ncbi:MAG: nicotinamide-nucleotide adenylyltransferase [Thermoplasmatota archaeon]
MRAMLLGRFQPFHLGHARVVEHALEAYEGLVLIIGSATESYTYANPFTGGERHLMIQRTLEDMEARQVSIVSVPDIHRYGVYASHVADLAPPFDVVLSNKELIRYIFEKEGYQVESTPVFKRQTYAGTEVRRRMATGEDWHSLVPDGVAEVVDRIGGAERVKGLYAIERSST